MKLPVIDYKNILNLVLAVGLFTTTIHTINQDNHTITTQEYREILLDLTYEAFYDAESFEEQFFLHCMIEHLRICPEPLEIMTVSYDPKLQALINDIFNRASLYMGLMSTL